MKFNEDKTGAKSILNHHWRRSNDAYTNVSTTRDDKLELK